MLKPTFPFTARPSRFRGNLEASERCETCLFAWHFALLLRPPHLVLPWFSTSDAITPIGIWIPWLQRGIYTCRWGPVAVKQWLLTSAPLPASVLPSSRRWILGEWRRIGIYRRSSLAKWTPDSTEAAPSGQGCGAIGKYVGRPIERSPFDSYSTGINRLLSARMFDPSQPLSGDGSPLQVVIDAGPGSRMQIETACGDPAEVEPRSRTPLAVAPTDRSIQHVTRHLPSTVSWRLAWISQFSPPPRGSRGSLVCRRWRKDPVVLEHPQAAAARWTLTLYHIETESRNGQARSHPWNFSAWQNISCCQLRRRLKEYGRRVEPH